MGKRTLIDIYYSAYRYYCIKTNPMIVSTCYLYSGRFFCIPSHPSSLGLTLFSLTQPPRNLKEAIFDILHFYRMGKYSERRELTAAGRATRRGEFPAVSNHSIKRDIRGQPNYLYILFILIIACRTPRGRRYLQEEQRVGAFEAERGNFEQNTHPGCV